ncbi:hypothetical protein [Litoribacillus peritrichatus]|uniref:MSHA biogenesis protein MshP n=1 Tax=Litoribacillus peritrichatus TaxID=718191 RepID=A0ABP7MTK7_9GAMM
MRNTAPKLALSGQSGFALPAVIFLIVIVALIIAALERISNNQTAISTMGLQSSRAYMAAYSGVEWAAYQVQIITLPTDPSCPPLGKITGLDLYGFEVSVSSCTETNFVEGSTNISSFEVTVLATYGGTGQYGKSPDFASRELTVSMVVEN